MKATKFFIIRATKTHEDITEGGIHILHRFENQSKAIQHHEIVAVPEKYKDMAEVGDTLVCHFNVVVYDRKDGKVTPSRYFVIDDLFRVPDNMLHFVIKKDGRIIFFEDYCLIEGKFSKDDVVLDSGIILPDLRTDIKKKDGLMEGVVYAKSDAMTDVEIGDRVGLDKYSDYEMKLPNGKEVWYLSYDSVLFKYDEQG